MLRAGANFIQYVVRSFAKSFQDSDTAGQAATNDSEGHKPTLYEVPYASLTIPTLHCFLTSGCFDRVLLSHVCSYIKGAHARPCQYTSTLKTSLAFGKHACMCQQLPNR